MSLLTVISHVTLFLLLLRRCSTQNLDGNIHINAQNNRVQPVQDKNLPPNAVNLASDHRQDGFQANNQAGVLSQNQPRIQNPGVQANVPNPGLQQNVPNPGLQQNFPNPGLQQNFPNPGLQQNVPHPGLQQNVPNPGLQQNVPRPGLQQNVPNPGLQQNVPNPGLQQNVPHPGFQQNVPNPGLQQNVPHPGLQQNVPNPGLQQNIQNPGLQQNAPNPGLRQPVQEQAQHPNKGPLLISEVAACKDDVQKFCHANQYNLMNNFDVITCLSSEKNIDDVSVECNQHIWEYKVSISKNTKYHKVVESLCKPAMKTVPKCQNGTVDARFIACLMENIDDIQLSACVDFLTKVRIITFSDYHLIEGFIQACEGDVKRLKCGKLDLRPDEVEPNDFTHSQEEVVSCLEDHLDEDVNALSSECDLQITRLAELSAQDFHLDHDLYLKCKGDRENFCAEVIAGEGRVYQCLYAHKFNDDMSPACRNALTSRQQLEGKDYKANYPLAHSCKQDIITNKCDIPEGTHVGDTNHHVRSSTILLCLESSQRNGVPLSEDCKSELMVFRQTLMSDYEISPEITHNCGAEILQKCERGLEKQGKTIHCLLELAQVQDGLSQDCRNVMMNFIKETEVAKDYRMDPVLTEACKDVIHVKCRDYKEGDPMILGCLMDHTHDKDMPKQCKSAVVDLQYFISRDFLVDPVFRDVCQEDAERICKTPVHLAAVEEQTSDTEFVLPLSLVISCLYRHVLPSKEVPKPVSPDCAAEIHQVIKQRAMNFNLNPELEANCRSDLGEHCSSKQHSEGTEFQCLQDNYDKLSPNCQEKVGELTKMEGKDVMDFDNMLVQECEPMLQQFCGHLIKSADDGAVMQCLIENKESMSNRKCAAGITHYQLVEMKNFKLNYNFMKACENDVLNFCPEKDLKTEADIIACLSLAQRNSILNEGATHSISEECRKEISIEKLQMHKNILLNPQLAKNCEADQQKHCRDAEAGEAEVIECLREHKEFLQHDCYLALFQFEAEEATAPELDFQLMSKCQSTIQELCVEDMDEDDADYVLECLIRNKHTIKDKKCKHIVIDREKEMFSDISLNPQLLKSCSEDIDRHCITAKLEATKDHEVGEDPHGVIYECLKDKYTEGTLKTSCHRHIEFVIREEQQDFQLDPQLVLKCVDSIEKHCSPSESSKNVIECLKKSYYKGKLAEDSNCMIEVAKIILEGHTDIKADPILEHSCAKDLKKHCSEIPEGHGRLITCLVRLADDDDETKLRPECRDQLEMRRKMWGKAVHEKVQGFHDIHKAVQSSENSSYILSVTTLVVLLILIAGIFCGRISRKVMRNRKRVL